MVHCFNCLQLFVDDCSSLQFNDADSNWMQLIWIAYTLFHIEELLADDCRCLPFFAGNCCCLHYRRVIGVAFHCKEFYPLASPDIFSNPRLNLFRNSSSKCVFRRELPVTRRYYRLMRLYICHYVYARWLKLLSN